MLIGHGEDLLRRVVPMQLEVPSSIPQDCRRARRSNQHVCFEIEIVETAPRQVGRTQQQTALAALAFDEHHLGVTMFAMSMRPPYLNIRLPEFRCHGPIRNAVFSVSKCILIRIKQYAHYYAL